MCIGLGVSVPAQLPSLSGGATSRASRSGDAKAFSQLSSKQQRFVLKELKSICVTVNGNVVQFAVPNDVSQKYETNKRLIRSLGYTCVDAHVTQVLPDDHYELSDGSIFHSSPESIFCAGDKVYSLARSLKNSEYSLGPYFEIVKSDPVTDEQLIEKMSVGELRCFIPSKKRCPECHGSGFDQSGRSSAGGKRQKCPDCRGMGEVPMDPGSSAYARWKEQRYKEKHRRVYRRNEWGYGEYVEKEKYISRTGAVGTAGEDDEPPPVTCKTCGGRGYVTFSYCPRCGGRKTVSCKKGCSFGP